MFPHLGKMLNDFTHRCLLGTDTHLEQSFQVSCPGTSPLSPAHGISKAKISLTTISSFLLWK